MKRITAVLIIITCCKAMAKSQSYYMIGIDKTIGTNYRLPALHLGYGYKYKIFTSEFGLKTNYNEYYTLAFTSIGLESKTKLLYGVNAGIGWVFSIPELDRKFDPVTKETKTITEGYEEKVICSYYANVKVGYPLFKVFSMQGIGYGGYSVGFKSWDSIGIKLTSIK